MVFSLQLERVCPTRQYLAWNINPLGYHLTGVILHILSSFVNFLVVWRMTRNRAVAILTALLFALLPVGITTDF